MFGRSIGIITLLLAITLVVVPQTLFAEQGGADDDTSPFDEMWDRDHFGDHTKKTGWRIGIGLEGLLGVFYPPDYESLTMGARLSFRAITFSTGVPALSAFYLEYGLSYRAVDHSMGYDAYIAGSAGAGVHFPRDLDFGFARGAFYVGLRFERYYPTFVDTNNTRLSYRTENIYQIPLGIEMHLLNESFTLDIHFIPGVCGRRGDSSAQLAFVSTYDIVYDVGVTAWIYLR